MMQEETLMVRVREAKKSLQDLGVNRYALTFSTLAENTKPEERFTVYVQTRMSARNRKPEAEVNGVVHTVYDLPLQSYQPA
jgi:hypothetical protein